MQGWWLSHIGGASQFLLTYVYNLMMLFGHGDLMSLTFLPQLQVIANLTPKRDQFMNLVKECSDNNPHFQKVCFIYF